MQFWGIESSTSRMPGGSFPILPWAESPDMQLVCHGLLWCAHEHCLPCLPLSPSHCQSVLMQVPLGGGGGGGGDVKCSGWDTYVVVHGSYGRG